MTLRLPRSYVEQMVDHALRGRPEEACGVILGENGEPRRLYELENAEHSPYRYAVGGKDLLMLERECRENDWQYLVIYHSHTQTEAYPSPTDVRLAALRPEPYYVVISLREPGRPLARAFRIVDAQISEEPLEVSEA